MAELTEEEVRQNIEENVQGMLTVADALERAIKREYIERGTKIRFDVPIETACSVADALRVSAYILDLSPGDVVVRAEDKCEKRHGMMGERYGT